MGLLPLPEMQGLKVTFRYRSPLSLSKGQQDIARFSQYYQLMQGMYGPSQALMYINSGLFPYLIAEQMQVDARYLNDPKQVQKVAQQAQDQQDEMMANAQAQGQELPPEAQPQGEVA
jgi:Na+/H+ antiporter NhaB